VTDGLDLRTLIRTVPDFPRPGVQFRDITTLLKRPEGLRAVVERLAAHHRARPVDKVAAIESRGFMIGAPLALELRAGLVPVRKKGKLPAENFGQDYTLEYGTDRLEMHRDAIARGERVLLVDDLIATGGTAEAALKLIGMAGGSVIGCAFVIDLPGLGGRARLEARGVEVVALCAFEVTR
jgi:adenine phosphoribosyltransferase